MSDNTATETVDASASDVDGGAPGRRLIVLVAALSGLLVFGLALYFLLLSGGSETEPETAPFDRASQGSEPEEEDGESEKVPREVDETVTVGRDPFAPLAVEAIEIVPVDSSDDGTDVGGDTGGTDPDPQPTVQPSPDPQPTVDPTPDPDPTKDPDGSDDDVTTFKVTLKSVNVKQGTATLEVNGKRYVVKEGKMFTNSKTGPFKLLWVGELPPGKDAARVKFGSEAPVEILEKDKTVFELPG